MPGCSICKLSITGERVTIPPAPEQLPCCYSIFSSAMSLMDGKDRVDAAGPFRMPEAL